MFRIDASNGLAIYDQIVRQVKFSIAEGVWRSGDLVPSVRELSKQLAINPNTVARAYRKLQDDEVLESVRGTGLQVTAGAAKRCRATRRQLIKERISSVISEAAASGLSADEIEELVEKELQGLKRKQKGAKS
ncbi:MAG: GntR family transcriptional regulator [Planctomycetota bacterium]